MPKQYSNRNGMVRRFSLALESVLIASFLNRSQNNIRGSTARAVNSAVVVGGGGLGGIIASVSLITQDNPDQPNAT